MYTSQYAKNTDISILRMNKLSSIQSFKTLLSSHISLAANYKTLLLCTITELPWPLNPNSFLFPYTSNVRLLTQFPPCLNTVGKRWPNEHYPFVRRAKNQTTLANAWAHSNLARSTYKWLKRKVSCLQREQFPIRSNRTPLYLMSVSVY